MNSFEELMQKATEQLKNQQIHSYDTPIFRGIGYALLALAVAVREDKNKKTNS